MASESKLPPDKLIAPLIWDYREQARLLSNDAPSGDCHVNQREANRYVFYMQGKCCHDQTSRGSGVVSQLEIDLCLFMESSILCCSGSTRNGLSVCDRIAVTCSCQGCDTSRHLGKVLNLEGWSKRCWCNRWQQYSRRKASTIWRLRDNQSKKPKRILISPIRQRD